jgi:hypothetical protein
MGQTQSSENRIKMVLKNSFKSQLEVKQVVSPAGSNVVDIDMSGCDFGSSDVTVNVDQAVMLDVKGAETVASDFKMTQEDKTKLEQQLKQEAQNFGLSVTNQNSLNTTQMTNELAIVMEKAVEQSCKATAFNSITQKMPHCKRSGGTMLLDYNQTIDVLSDCALNDKNLNDVVKKTVTDISQKSDQKVSNAIAAIMMMMIMGLVVGGLLFFLPGILGLKAGGQAFTGLMKNPSTRILAIGALFLLWYVYLSWDCNNGPLFTIPVIGVRIPPSLCNKENEKKVWTGTYVVFAVVFAGIFYRSYLDKGAGVSSDV